MITFDEARNLLDYDQHTGLFTWKVSAGTAKAGSVAGTPHERGYIQVGVRGKRYFAHRLAWLMTHAVWPSDQLDHINGDPSDNRLVNLRECNTAENQQNQGLHRDNTSGFTGVTWHASRGRWQAQIKAHGRNLYLGLHESPEQAYEAYLAAKADLHRFQPIPRVAA